MAYTRTRLSLVEYGSPIDLSHEIASAIGVDRARANTLLVEVGNRAASTLGFSYNPISVDAKGARAIDFAGLIRLAPSLELEVAPKFLGLDNFDAQWREDFFFLSTLSRHGRLLDTERLLASGNTPRDLATLVARSITSMYEVRKRRPLRSYRRVREADFFIDGDPDPLDLIFPSPDGFEQELIRFDRWNGWNADIVGAAKELLPEVRDPSVVGSLIRLIEDLSPQNAPTNRRRPIPPRHRTWKPLHELSIGVLGGLGLSYTQGKVHAPGYLVTTWRVWEDLLTLAARLGFGTSAVMSQKGFSLGTKIKIDTGGVSKISVYPDCVIESDGNRPRMLLDAKYKGHVEKGKLRIAESDVYEALAFSRAADCNLVVLAYPAKPGNKSQQVGTCTIFESIQVDDVRIVGIQIEIRGISKRGALRQLSRTLANVIPSACV
ncbi:5-methylcytosine restriction system specificity protein McrC [Marinobacter sp. ANT_B65]|uniref:5-methylcytosine restriction system specificity protein McrC n=1 Tax=Marinobacter sp. ANT_B65 TaxID=2039467 RepID=UPI000BBE681C|nr:restriction endonuclease [Marinobacter sp. ANT_B65]PCM45560.1 restriction endonuclease [Marinobacter sp. ANT_B65]